MSQHRVSAKKGKGKGGWWRVARSAVTQAAAVTRHPPPKKYLLLFFSKKYLLLSLFPFEKRGEHVTCHSTGLVPRKEKARAAGGESPAAVTSKQAPVVAPGAPP